MKRFFQLWAALLIITILSSFSFALADEEPQCDWCKFSECLVKSVNSDNEGVRLCAMRLIIRHADRLDVNDARYAVMDVFMNHKDPKVRQLAMVTLYKINHPLDMGLLELQLKFEEDPMIKKHLAAILFETDRLPAGYQLADEKVAVR